tara:strand:- start:1034 stop:1297 length:264 start_codon:yes stop_codon:yes gene_type:complete
MIQFLISVIEWIAMAGMTLLGVSYEQDTACPSQTSEFVSIEYVVPKSPNAEISFSPADELLLTAECAEPFSPHWVPASSEEIILIRT